MSSYSNEQNSRGKILTATMGNLEGHGFWFNESVETLQNLWVEIKQIKNLFIVRLHSVIFCGIHYIFLGALLKSAHDPTHSGPRDPPFQWLPKTDPNLRRHPLMFRDGDSPLMSPLPFASSPLERGVDQKTKPEKPFCCRFLTTSFHPRTGHCPSWFT